MKTVTKRELNQRTADVLAAAAGEAVTVTERGVARWRIERIDGEDDAIARLDARGLISQIKKDPAPWPEHDHATYTPEEIDRLLADARGER